MKGRGEAKRAPPYLIGTAPKVYMGIVASRFQAGGMTMKRTAPIMTTVLMIAILASGGHVGSGLAQTDLPPSFDINGASGRSVHEYTETPVFFWWTAPATVPVVFDTQGSDFDTLLAVYAVDSLAEIAFNDDAGGTLQSAVRFTAQEGLEYAIIVDSFANDDQIGTIVLNWRASSPGAKDAPVYILAGQNASIWYWTTDDTVTQSLYASTDGTVSVRTFYDVDGLPHKVLDERTGSWMWIQRYDSKNVDFWFYDEDGTYQGGLAVFEAKGRYYYAEIDGEPVHAGKRITGFLQPTEASWTGNYTLKVDMSIIQDPQPMPRDIAALIDSLTADGTGRTGMVTGWRSRLAALLRPFGAWLSPGVAVAQPIQDVLFWGGLAMVGMGTAGLLAPVYVTAGAVTFLNSFLAADIAEGIRLRCQDNPGMAPDSRIAYDYCHLAADNLAHPDAHGPFGALRDAVEWASNRTQRIRDRIARGRRALSSIVQDTAPSGLPQETDESEPFYSHHDISETETVRGTMEREGREPVDVKGTVTPDGDFSAMGDGVEIAGSIGDGSSVTGEFVWDNDNGAIGGNLFGHPALIRPLPDWQGPVGASHTLDMSNYFEDPNDGPLNYEAASPDPNIVRADLAGTMLIMTAVGQGTTYVTVSAWNTDNGRITTGSFSIVVYDAGGGADPPEDIYNRPPENALFFTFQKLKLGTPIVFDMSARFRDLDGDSLRYTATSSDPSVVTVSVSGNVITVTPVGVGTANVTMTAYDPYGETATQTTQMRVSLDGQDSQPPGADNCNPSTAWRGAPNDLQVSSFCLAACSAVNAGLLDEARAHCGVGRDFDKFRIEPGSFVQDCPVCEGRMN